MATLSKTLAALQKVVGASKKKTQNTSLDKYELLWNYEEQFKNVTQEEVKQVQGKFMSIFVNDLIFQEPTSPLRRVMCIWISKLCSLSGSISQALSAIKAFQTIIQKKTNLSTKIAAMESIGYIYSGLGLSIASSAGDTVTFLMKQFKSGTPAKRITSVSSIIKILEGIKSSGTFLHTGILKNIKQIINDKEVLVRTEIANLLGVIASHCSLQNIEIILSYAVKLCEDPSPHTRSSAAFAIGSCFAVAHDITLNNSKKKNIVNSSTNSNIIQKLWTTKTILDYLNNVFLKIGNNNSGKRELRSGITLSVVSFLQQLPTRIIRSDMNIIIEKILSLLLNESMKYYSSLTELLQAHLCTGHMLNDGLRDRLGEEGQKKMAESLINVINNDSYNEYILILALRQLSYLFLDLGEGAGPLWDKIEIPLSKLLSHQSYSVRGVCAITTRSLATALPDFHAKLLRAYLNVTTMEFAQLTSCEQNEVKFHLGPLQGNAYAVAGLISIIPHSVLGVPNTITNFCLKKAKTLIEIDPSCKYAAMVVARAEAGWSIISALMNLGPNFVESKLVEILEKWDNTFQNLENVQPKTEKAIVVFSRLKSCALEALCNFIIHNNSLLGTDIIERTVFWLKNLLQVITKFPKLPNCASSTTDIINVLKANLVKTYTSLPVNSYSISYVSLMTWLIHELPRNATTSLFRSLLNENDSILGPWLSGKELKDAKLVQSPAVVVHDHSVVWSSNPEKELTNPLPSSKHLVDEILGLFPKLYIVQTEEHQKTIILHLMRCVKESPPELRNSLQTNVFCLLITTLRELNEKKKPFPKGTFLKPLLLFIESFLSNTDIALRRAAAECIGLMALLQGNKFTDHIVNSINQTLKTSKDPINRAGCGFSLACIIRKLGGMKSDYHLPATVSILHVLAKDSSSLVRLWSLHSLWVTIETTSLSFASFAHPTLSLALSLLLSTETTTPAIYQSIGRVVNSCISCLGPELQPNSPHFKTCCAVISELDENPNPLIQLEGINFKQMLSLFAPQTINANDSLEFLRNHLQSRFSSLRQASIICLRQLFQIYAHNIKQEGLEEQLLRMLDRERDIELRNELQLLILSIVEYIGPKQVTKFLDLFRTVIASSTSMRSASAPGKDIDININNEEEDEEDESIDASGQLTQVSEIEEDDSVFVPRWRTRVFCMECIGTLIDVIGSEKSQPEHFNMILANKILKPKNNNTGDDITEFDYQIPDEEKKKYLVYHLQELVTVSFNCSTSQINALRPIGIKVLQNIVERFAHAEDPDYDGHKLLELYSAQVAAALRPAFHKDRSPLLTAAATDVVVSFVRNTITAEVSALQKVTRLLTSFIDTVENLEYPSYSEKASTMVQLKILGAIAQLYNATLLSKDKTSGSLLKEILDPFLSKLCKLWMMVLRDWAILSTQNISIKKAYKGSFYKYSSISFVMDYYRDVCSNIILSQASLLDSTHWRDSSYEKNQQQNTLQASYEDFSILVGLCIHTLIDQTGSNVISILNSCTFLFTCKSFITPQWLPLNQWQELIDAYQLQMQIGDKLVQHAIISSLGSIILKFSDEYFTATLDSNIIKYFIHSLVELSLYPLLKYNISQLNDDYLKDLFTCISNLSRLLELSKLYDLYIPYICITLQKVILNIPTNLLSNALTSLSLYIKIGNSSQILSSCFYSFLNNIKTYPQNINIITSILSFITLSLSIQIPNQLHEQSLLFLFSILKSNNNDDDITLKYHLSNLLLQLFQSNTKSLILIWYIKNISSWIIYTLLTIENISNNEENYILNLIKILVLSHTLCPEDQCSSFLSLVIPALVQLLKPSIPNTISDFALKVIQSLGNTDANSFKQIADALPTSYRTLLDSAANIQQKQQQVSSRRNKRAKPKKLTMDFSQYD